MPIKVCIHECGNKNIIQWSYNTCVECAFSNSKQDSFVGCLFRIVFCILCCDSLLFTHFEFRFVLFTNKLHAIHNVRFDCKSTVVAFVQFGSVLFCSWFAFMMFIVDFNSNMSMQRYICNLYGHRIVCVESFLLDR